MKTETKDKNIKNVSVYYDGLCHLCSREINHYKKMKGSERIDFIDITSPSFDAKKQNLDPIKIHQSLHVRDKIGNTYIGVDAFISIWNEINSLKFLVPIARHSFVHRILEFFYKLFTLIRPLLPRKSCEISPYCEIQPKS